MEQTLSGALERIENPILIILLGVLMIAVAALWLRDAERQKMMYSFLEENIGAVHDTAAELARIREQLEELSRRLPT